ncbi:vacuolar membrane-associated protein iml1 [Elasticomyces elasticus]|nr:vacuolar membrane-associated protein iml1 [Elasticomyces elasticus]
MAIDQLRRSCTVVLHDDRISTDDVLCGSSVLPTGILAKLSVSGASPLHVLPTTAALNHDEVSVHISLAQRFGLENRAKATLHILETAETAAATATHIEFFFRDQHLSRADMWRIMQRLDGTVVYQGQKVHYLGSPTADVRAIYVSGKEVSSAFVTHGKTKPIFRSGSARYTILVQVSKEMLEHWVDGDLMYERVIDGFLPELFQKWDALKVRHRVSVVLFGRDCKERDSKSNVDFFHVVASDVPSSEWRGLLRRLKLTLNGSSPPSQVSLAASGNMLEAIHMAAMDSANDRIDPQLGSGGTSIIAITAGAGMFATSHDMLSRTTHLLMGNSIGVDIVALAPKPLHPVPLFSYQRNDMREFALPHWVDVSYWKGDRSDYVSSWALPKAAGTMNAALPTLDGHQSTLDMDDHDAAVFGDRKDISVVAPMLLSSITEAVVPETPGGWSDTSSMGQTRPWPPRASDPMVARADAPLPTPIKAIDRTVLPPHSLMATGRKISLGPKGLALGRGLASTTVSVQHAQHDREQSLSAPFSPDESSSGIAKQIRMSLARKPSHRSITSQLSSLPPVTSKPINISKDQHDLAEDYQDPASMLEHNMQGAMAGTGHASTSETPTPKSDIFYSAMKAAEQEGYWKTSPWLTLLNPSNPSKGNMRVAAQFRKWQHIFPRAVSPTEFKWSSMCYPAALPLTTEYKPSSRELDRHYTKIVRRLMVPNGADQDHVSAKHAFAQLIKLRLTYGFQLSTCEHFHSNSGEQVFMSLGNVHHDLQYLSDAELQVVEYTLNDCDGGGSNGPDDNVYCIRVRGVLHVKASRAEVLLASARPETKWSRLDEEVISRDPSHADHDVTRMRLVLIPVNPSRPGHMTPGPARGLSDEERHIDGIQKLTQLWQKNRYTAFANRRHQVSIARGRATPIMTARDPNPLAIEYQTRDPSAAVNAYGPHLAGSRDSHEPAVPLFAESELYHSSSFDITKLVKQMQEPPPQGVEVRDRRWLTRTHFKCFRGDEMVNWLLRVFKNLVTREDAIAVGNELMDRGVFSHVRAKHEFRDGNYFFQIASMHRTTVYPDNASMFAKGSLKSMPATPISELKGSPMLRANREDETSSGKPTPTMSALQRHILLSEQMMYNVDPASKSDQGEIVTLHYDRIHNPENCYHIMLEYVNTTSSLLRDAISRWSTLAETHGLKMVQVPLVEASKLNIQHPFDHPISVKLALPPPEKVPVTPMMDALVIGIQSIDDPQAAYKALLRSMDFVLDIEAASTFTTKLDVLYSYGRPDYQMTQFVHKSGLLLAQISDTAECDFKLVPNRLAVTRLSTTGRPVDAEPVETIVKRFVDFCRDGAGLELFYEELSKKARLPPPSPSAPLDFGQDSDVPPIQLPPRLAHRAVLRNIL